MDTHSSGDGSTFAPRGRFFLFDNPLAFFPTTNLLDQPQFPAQTNARRVLREYGIGTREADEAAAEAAASAERAFGSLQDALRTGEAERASAVLAAILDAAIAADLAAPDTQECETGREIAADAVHAYRTNHAVLGFLSSGGSAFLSVPLVKEYRAMTVRVLEQAALLLKRTKQSGGWQLMERAEWARDEAAALLQILLQQPA